MHKEECFAKWWYILSHTGQSEKLANGQIGGKGYDRA